MADPIPVRGGTLTTLPLRLLSDERLAQLARSGQTSAFGALYERHSAALLRYCRSITLHAEDARDAHHNAMVKAMRAIASDAPPRGAVRPWLFRIVHNEAVSLLRRRRTHQDLDAVDDLPLPGDEADPGATRDRLRQLVADLGSLPERQRGALLMRELCGLRYDEIADAIGGTPQSARQSVADARNALTAFEHGRDLACASVRDLIADGDGRALRARHLKAHVRDCAGCRDYHAVVSRRRRDLAILVPPVPAAGIIAAALGGAAATTSVLASTATKTAAATVLVAVVGVGATQVVTDRGTGANRHDDRADVRRTTSSPPPAATRTHRAAPAGTTQATPAAQATSTPKPRTVAAAPRGGRKAKAPAVRRAAAKPATKATRTARPKPNRTSKPKPKVRKTTPAPAATTATPAPTATASPAPTATTVAQAPSSPNTGLGAGRQATSNPLRTYLDQVRTNVQTQVDTQMAAARTQVQTAVAQANSQVEAARTQWRDALAQALAPKTGTP